MPQRPVYNKFLILLYPLFFSNHDLAPNSWEDLFCIELLLPSYSRSTSRHMDGQKLAWQKKLDLWDDALRMGVSYAKTISIGGCLRYISFVRSYVVHSR